MIYKLQAINLFNLEMLVRFPLGNYKLRISTIIIRYFGILYGKQQINAAKEVKSIGRVIIWHMTLCAQLIVFKGCMAWSSWSGVCEECNEYRERVGKWQEGVLVNLWLTSAMAGFRHCFTTSKNYTAFINFYSNG